MRSEETRYFLSVDTTDSIPFISLTADEHAAIRHACALLTAALHFEQGYDLVLSSFIAFELKITEISLRSILESDLANSEAFAKETAVNLQVLNVLTSGRAYFDQSAREFKSFAFGESFLTLAKSLRSAEYDVCRSFRFVEALRNFVQHSGRAVHSWVGRHRSFGEPWAEAMTFYADREKFQQDRCFKSSVLAEMDEYSVDLRDAIRKHCSALSRIHFALRDHLALEVSAARGLLDHWIARYRELYNGPLNALTAFASRDAMSDEDQWMLVEWDEARIALTNKNSLPIELHRYNAG